MEWWAWTHSACTPKKGAEHRKAPKYRTSVYSRHIKLQTSTGQSLQTQLTTHILAHRCMAARLPPRASRHSPPLQAPPPHWRWAAGPRRPRGQPQRRRRRRRGRARAILPRLACLRARARVVGAQAPSTRQVGPSRRSTQGQPAGAPRVTVAAGLPGS